MMPIIPPKRNRKVAREYDAVLYQARHLAANGFERFKAWRGDVLCEDCGVVPGDLLDTSLGYLGPVDIK